MSCLPPTAATPPSADSRFILSIAINNDNALTSSYSNAFLLNPWRLDDDFRHMVSWGVVVRLVTN